MVNTPEFTLTIEINYMFLAQNCYILIIKTLFWVFDEHSLDIWFIQSHPEQFIIRWFWGKPVLVAVSFFIHGRVGHIMTLRQKIWLKNGQKNYRVSKKKTTDSSKSLTNISKCIMNFRAKRKLLRLGQIQVYTLQEVLKEMLLCRKIPEF